MEPSCPCSIRASTDALSPFGTRASRTTDFCQVAFHTLFWADFYLGQDDDEKGGEFRRQPFHRANERFFGDYEEFEDRAPVSLYDKTSIVAYMEHCRNKAAEVVATESAEALGGPSGFAWREFSRAELHVYNIRSEERRVGKECRSRGAPGSRTK